MADPDFGSDLSLVDDLTPTMTEVSGVRVVAEAIYRRLITPRGSLIDDPDYGFDVRSLLSKGATQAQLAAIPGIVKGEVLKDERIDSVEVTVEDLTATGFTLTIAAQTGAGPFTLVLNVTELLTSLQLLEAA